jgi:hypothetical protein
VEDTAKQQIGGLDYSDATLSCLKEVRRHLVNGFKDMPDEELIVAGIFLTATKA